MSSPTADRSKLQAKAAGAGVRQRRTGAGASSGGGTVRTRANGVNTGGLWRFYTEDSTGLKIGPVPVLVLSLVFIASVFILHIWGKYTRSTAQFTSRKMLRQKANRRRVQPAAKTGSSKKTAIEIGPFPLIMFSLLFIASVFILHIVAKVGANL
ncbi:Protein transport protein Sec61 subunit beta [Aphelenchoides bicaudatus]|nr:Protein transport protein Sec61 subunit beta [Aphelenchoides bicaudatus]